MPSGRRRLRPYRASGLYRVTPPTPAQQRTAEDLRSRLIADHCDGAPTAAQDILLSLLAAAAAKHADAWAYLKTLPRPWVNRKANKSWQIIHDTSKLERHVARLVAALVDPALERRPIEVEDIRTIAAREAAGTDSEPAPDAVDHPPSSPQ